MIAANEITKDEFDELVARYPEVLASVSASKGAKSGQKTLQELDKYRYEEAPQLFSGDKPAKKMDLDAIKALVEWKLRHGKFRPTLMNLVSSNSAEVSSDTVAEAHELYKADGDVAKALAVLTRLRGIGPATASLILSALDPTGIIFFSDEAFYWLCCEGTKVPLKYNPKEYTALRSEAQKLASRLDVSAVDIEKAAYVLLNQSVEADQLNEAASKTASKTASKPAKKVSTKRKADLVPKSKAEGTPVRRSKRTKT